MKHRKEKDRAERKIVTDIDKKLGIINFDYDNLYPEYCYAAVSSSTTAKRAVMYYRKFIMGSGFRDENFATMIINELNQTSNHVLKLIAGDFAYHWGLALHYNYNLNGSVAEVTHMPFRYCRMCATPAGEYDPTKIAVYDDWSGVKRQGKAIKKEMVSYIDSYDPDPEVVIAQIEAAGGIQNYRGQVLYFSMEGPGVYPLAPYDSALNDIRTDAGTQTYRRRNVENGFLASHIVTTPPMSDPDAEAFGEDLRSFQGADDSCRIMHLEVQNTDEKAMFDIKKIELQKDAPTMFDSTTRQAKDGIIESFGIPPIVMGVRVPGELGGGTKERRDAYKSYNADTVEERGHVVSIFGDWASHWFETIAVTDFSIIPLQLETPGEQLSVAEMLGDNLPAAMLIVSGPLPVFQKENILVQVFGVPPEAAKIIVSDGTEGGKADAKSLAEKIGVGGVTAWNAIIQSTMTNEQKVQNLIILFNQSEDAAKSAVFGTPLAQTA